MRVTGSRPWCDCYPSSIHPGGKQLSFLKIHVYELILLFLNAVYHSKTALLIGMLQQALESNDRFNIQ